MNKGSTVGWEGWHSTRAVWNLSQSRAVARMAGLKLSLVQALSLQLSDSVTSTLSASVSFREHRVRVLTCSQVRGSVRDAESRCASQESVKGCGDGRFPGQSCEADRRPGWGPPSCGCAPRWKQLPISSHRHSGWKKVVIQVKQVYRLRWYQVVVRGGAAGGRVTCELGDGPFLIRQKKW